MHPTVPALSRLVTRLPALRVWFCAAAVLFLLGCSGEGDAKTGSSLFPKPPLPVSISWRETKLPGSTQVARLRPLATASLPLRVTVEVTSSSSGERKTKEWILERIHSENPREIGLLEGYQFVPGDIITVRHKDYAPVTATCGVLP